MLSDLETRTKLGGLADRLGEAFACSADPERAGRLAADVLMVASDTVPGALAEIWQQEPAAVERILATLMGAAPFLAAFFVRHPGAFVDLCREDFTVARSAQVYRSLLAGFSDRCEADNEKDVLRQFKYYELARITVRELCEDLVPVERTGETLAELSHLADALLSKALESAERELEASYGPPRWLRADGKEVVPRFCVLGLGKLGSEELNYSSDVDLIYVFEEPDLNDGFDGGPRGLAPTEYFTRLAQVFGRIVGDVTAEGFLYRVDLDLRPEGSRGQLVVSDEMLATYYEAWAATWERAAFMKARPVAGDGRFGWKTIRAIAPMIYRSAIDLAGMAAIREMKERVEREKGRLAETFDVKLGKGGIRDIEFVAQALQLLHGGRIPQVRGRSTQRTLVSLAEVGVLVQDEADTLLTAYRCLRRTENRLQMDAERQVHRLPQEPGALERIARAMGFVGQDPAGSFMRELEKQRRLIGEIFASLFPGGSAEQVLQIFVRKVPALIADPTTRRMIENLAGHFAYEIDNSANPERALNNVERFTDAIGSRRFFYELLLDRPELVSRLAALFASSEYLSGYLASHPRLIEPIFSDPNVLLLSKPELEDALCQIRNDLAGEERRDEVELELDALRLFHNRELVNVGLLELGRKVALAEAERALTEIAEVCVARALVIAESEMKKWTGGVDEGLQRGEFLVVGMGKLATGEITYGSDVDVIFLYDVPEGDEDSQLGAQEFFVRLAQKLIWALRTRTSEGVCYDIDARLRPSGNQGLLVSSLATFEGYHALSAQVWERQALLRARPVAGARRLSEAFDALRVKILHQPASEDVREAIHRVRVRMENELARESAQRRDFKTGRGGLQDVESIVQCLQLMYGSAHEELLEVAPIVRQIGRLERLALLSEPDAQVLREGWDFLRRLSSRLRIVANRSISDLDEERGDLDALARGLGYSEPQRAGGARRALLEDYRRHTGGIREVYLRVLEVNKDVR